MKYKGKASGYSHSVGYTYDALNNLTGIEETISEVKRTTTHAYDDNNRVTSSTTGTVSRTYGYDGFGRISQTSTKEGGSQIKTDTYSYTAPSSTTTSDQISRMRLTEEWIVIWSDLI